MLALALFGTGLGAVWQRFDILEMSDDERGAYDNGIKKFTGKSWFPWGEVKRAEDITVIGIDDKTFNDISGNEAWRLEFGSWPYDRRIYAEAFGYAHECGAKLFIMDATIDETRADPSGDILFGQTLRDEGIPLYLGFNASVVGSPMPRVEARNWPTIQKPVAVADAGADEAPAEDFPEEETAEQKAAKVVALKNRAAELYAFPVEVSGGIELTKFTPEEELDLTGKPTGTHRERHPVPAIEPLLESVSGFGTVEVEADEDGKMRKTRFAYTDGINSYVTLPVAAVADILHADKVSIEPGKLTIGDRSWAIDRDGSAWINFGGTFSRRFRSVSLVDVLRLRERKQGCELFKDKYVFLAGLALGTGDIKATPLEQAAPGAAKQLAIFDNLMHSGFITDAPYWLSLLFTFLVCFFSVALVMIVRNVFVDIGWPVLLWVGFFLITGSFLVASKLHVLSAMPSFAGTVASVLATAWERLFANRERDQLKERFAFFMEPQLVEMMVEQKELPSLEGKEQRITAFFSDIKGFSTFSEKFREDPKGLMRLLNRYLTAVTPMLTQHGGCIDKYIGDAVVGLFGAPLPHADHALRACKAALDVQVALHTLRAEFKKEGLPDVYTRIGLNTDSMLVGNIGSDQLMDYTAIGDGMNLAARLEGANKNYGTLILIGENTYLDVRDHVVAREVDMVRVAGKKNASRIYELMALKGQATPAQLQILMHYSEALAHTRARRFAEAISALDKALTLVPDDGPSLHLKKKCEQFLIEPPPINWDGVSNLEK